MPRVMTPLTKMAKANRNRGHEVSCSGDPLPHAGVAPKLRTALSMQIAKTRIIQIDIVVDCLASSNNPNLPPRQVGGNAHVDPCSLLLTQVSCPMLADRQLAMATAMPGRRQR